MPKLKPYIDGYMHITWNEKGMKSKDILPRPGVSMVFIDKKIWVNDKTFSNNIFIGIHNKVFNFKWEADEGFCFIIKFSPYGLSRFVKTNIHQIINKSVDSELIWGNSINVLHEQIITTRNMAQQIELVEHFLSAKFIVPANIEESIFRFADTLRKENELLPLNVLRKSVFLSTRQLERKFKELTGVNIQTYIRICRFEHAILLITQKQNLKLTEIGYASGYFDQPHFSNEFKLLSKFRPKNFLHSSPFYKFLSEVESRKNLLL